ncbi:hypothetical protein GGI25_000191 [Coemansia spiralis]|uniref:ER membrane protein complex subunit 10 n=2 Tax=Coemansia TaxID=4863 RepID=A0A9W8L181_9FUNG|nr:hypothetical protein BX070DRAFT_253874 [Coemansia spiralis]KAJ1987065.1 hypothetical protein EDC05_006013 [Coemansia umbellata]KAJ2625764.1 hypothetical protein GGI26_000225 [Coemansia sp. RSA 1358]KAJ2680887.1 hypothetical protein GGI25_000191 [Coemansia spiralis]
MRLVELTVIPLFLSALLAAASSNEAEPAITQTLDVFHNLSPTDYIQRGELQLRADGTAQYHSVGMQQPPQLQGDFGADPSLYTVVVRAKDAQFVLPIKRCRLNAKKKLEETFVVHENEGGVFHVDYDAGTGDNCLEKNRYEDPAWLTRVVVNRQVDGPVPVLAAAASIDASTGKEVQPEPQKSFLAKYWYYIIPIVLLLMLGGEEPQQEGNTRR